MTPFAAPPVLMVAGVWGWDMPFMFSQFGWKAALAVGVNTGIAQWICFFPKERRSTGVVTQPALRQVPWWLVGLHLLFLGAAVATAHHPVLCVGVFLYFLGLTALTSEYQDELPLRNSLLVGFFLAGLVVLGGPQRWWLEPLLGRLGEGALFAGATVLTAFVDNAAITYLAAQVPDLASGLKYAVVAGAVSGGGLTVIANAPNPAGYSILQERFGPSGISPLLLFAAAVPPTLIVMASFWLVR